VIAYDPTAWESLFVAEAGAAAALAGLVFVAVSINLRAIMASPSLPGRALESVALLVGVLSIASIGLVPHESAALLGGLVALVGLLVWSAPTILEARDARRGHPGQSRAQFIGRRLIMQLATVPYIIAGLSVVLGAGGGLYWLVPAFLLSFFGAVASAWVLLVEIMR
jgi:hypothetical protein